MDPCFLKLFQETRVHLICFFSALCHLCILPFFTQMKAHIDLNGDSLFFFFFFNYGEFDLFQKYGLSFLSEED